MLTIKIYLFCVNSPRSGRPICLHTVHSPAPDTARYAEEEARRVTTEWVNLNPRLAELIDVRWTISGELRF